MDLWANKGSFPQNFLTSIQPKDDKYNKREREMDGAATANGPSQAYTDYIRQDVTYICGGMMLCLQVTDLCHLTRHGRVRRWQPDSSPGAHPLQRLWLSHHVQEENLKEYTLIHMLFCKCLVLMCYV